MERVRYKFNLNNEPMLEPFVNQRQVGHVRGAIKFKGAFKWDTMVVLINAFKGCLDVLFELGFRKYRRIDQRVTVSG